MAGDYRQCKSSIVNDSAAVITCASQSAAKFIRFDAVCMRSRSACSDAPGPGLGRKGGHKSQQRREFEESVSRAVLYSRAREFECICV